MRDRHRTRTASTIVPVAVFLLLVLAFWRAPLRAAPDEQLTAGKLLVASDETQDPRFFQAVIYVVRHDSEGTMGLIINRPIARGPVDDLLKGIGADAAGSQVEIVVHYGGPVSGEKGFLLHTDDVTSEASWKTSTGIAMTSDAKIIQAIAAGAGPQRFLFALGYAGWAPGQLEGEIKANKWFIIPADEALIFDPDSDTKWRRAVDKRRIRL